MIGHDIINLRERLLSLNSKRYYLIYLRHINLSGDLFHQDPKEMVHIEEYIHSFSEKASYIHPGRFEAVAAREKVEQEFSVEKMVAETEKVYLSLLKSV